VEGTTFVVGGEPFRFVGANAAVIHGESTRADAERVIDAAAASRMSVLRVWALGEADGDGRAWRRHYAFRLGPDAWVEESFEHLDRVLAWAREANIRIIVVLANRWGDYGGFPQYARWAGITPRRSNLLPSELHAFLSSEHARELYRAHVERVVGRTNTVTGVPYRDDPAIFAWELVNELSAPTCAARDAHEAWTREMAAWVKELDPSHLVSAGHIGYKSAQSRDFWIRLHQIVNVDYADAHAYPQHLLDVGAPEDLGGWLDDRAHLARNVLRMPLVIGEIGIPRGDERFSSRSGWFDAFYARADEDAVSGALVWILKPWQGREDPHGIWPFGPFTEESAPVLEVMKRWGTAWASGPPDLQNPAVADAAPDAQLFPTDLTRIVPYTEGEWSDGRRGAKILTIDPWALAEGCVEDERGWLDYVALFEYEGAPTEITVSALANVPRATPPLGIRVLVDGTHVGTWNGPRAWQSEEDALARAFTALRKVRYLRLEATTADGAALLRRFTRELPADDRIVIDVRW
jgi:mannan endo-1,4-beta-mannosidase